ncbi:MAG TPA: hypothetical protein VGH38_10150, partial [Bryobacteraceae bacterium]
GIGMTTFADVYDDSKPLSWVANNGNGSGKIFPSTSTGNLNFWTNSGVLEHHWIGHVGGVWNLDYTAANGRTVTAPDANGTMGVITSATNGHCTQYSVASGVVTLGDAGLPCYPALGPGVLTRSLPSGLNDTVDLGSFSLLSGLATFEISIVGDTSGLSQAQSSKTYTFGVSWSSTSGAWQILAPVTQSVRNSGDDFSLDVNVNSGTVLLRVRRSAAANPGSGNLIVNVQRSGYTADTFTASTTTATGVSAPTAFYAGSMIPMQSLNTAGLQTSCGASGTIMADPSTHVLSVCP